MRRALAVFSLLLAGIGCSAPPSGPSELATDYLQVRLTETGSPEACKFEQYSTIAKSIGLYMFEFDRQTSGSNGRGKMLSQMKFTGHDQIDYVRDETISLALEQAPCASYDVVWTNLRCKNTERQSVECPEVRFTGVSPFKSVRVER